MAKVTHPNDAAFLTEFLPVARQRLSFYTRDRDDLDEVVGDVMLACTGALSTHRDHSGQTDLGSIESFCWRILYNCLNNHLRRKYRKQKNLDSEIECLDTLEEQSSARGMHLRPYLKELMAFVRTKLTPNQLIVIELRAIQELSIEEISERLGISRQAVRSRLNAAKKKIAEYLELPADELRSDEDDVFDEVDLKVAELGRALGM